MFRIIIASISVLLLYSLMTGCGSDTQSKTNSDSTQVSEVSSDVDLTFEAYDIDGSLRRSSEWIGKQPTVINFWGTWCPPCRAEIPHLVELYDEYNKKGLEIIGISFPPRDTPQKVSRFASQNNMNWVLLMGEIDLAKELQLSAVPTTMFIGKDGKFKKVWDPATQDSTYRISGARSYADFKSMFDQVL